MKLSLSKLLFLGIIVQIFAIQGILMFNIFDVLGNWELKSILHPIGVSACFVYIVIRSFNKNKKLQLSVIEVLLFIYFTLCTIHLIFNSDSVFDIYIGVREVILIFLLIFIYSRVKLSFNQWRTILKILYILVLLNILFIALTYILGPEQYMKLVTGRYIWPTDEEYKFKISNIYSFWRSPALIGESTAVGYFGVLSYFLFKTDEKYKRKVAFPLILVILSFTRSVYLVLAIFLFFKFILKTKNLRRIETILPYSIPFLLFILFILYRFNLLSVYSILKRIEHWFNDINVDYNLLTGGAFGKVGGAARGQGFVAVLDSYWILMLTSVGVIGIILVILFLLEKTLHNQTNKVILIAFSFACFFVTITQSISFIVLFPLIFLNKHSIYEREH